MCHGQVSFHVCLCTSSFQHLVSARWGCGCALWFRLVISRRHLINKMGEQFIWIIYCIALHDWTNQPLVIRIYYHPLAPLQDWMNIGFKMRWSVVVIITVCIYEYICVSAWVLCKGGHQGYGAGLTIIKLGTITLPPLAPQAPSPSLTVLHLLPSTISVNQLDAHGSRVYTALWASCNVMTLYRVVRKPCIM